MSIITLTTDYGHKDYFVAALKGKIYSRHPQAVVVDLSHEVEPFNIFDCFYIVQSAHTAFPPGTVHFIGVDLDRHTHGQHLVMLWNQQYFIAADNGLLSLLIQEIKPEKILSINFQERMPKEVSDLDVLLTVAVHLAKGGPLSVVGRETAQIKTLNLPQAVLLSDRKTVQAPLLYVDHYGNAVFNLTKKQFQDMGKSRRFEIQVGSGKLKNIHLDYSTVYQPDKHKLSDVEGMAFAQFNEQDFLQIGIFRPNPRTVGTAYSLLGFAQKKSITIKFV